MSSSTARFLMVSSLLAGSALAQQSPQVPLPGSRIPRWAQPLPLADHGGRGDGVPVVHGYRTASDPTTSAVTYAPAEVQLSMCEFQASILPPGTPVANAGARAAPRTWVWGYVPDGKRDCAGRDTFVGPLIIASRNTPTAITYTNRLPPTSLAPDAGGTRVDAWRHGVDATLHWADPLRARCSNGKVPAPPSTPNGPVGPCAANYVGPVPTVPHLHGGEVPPEIDGGPDAWFTSSAAWRGPAFYQGIAAPGTTLGENEVRYVYPNRQEAAPGWFHDHTLGVTRLNVYAGLAGAYLVTDPALALPGNLPGVSEIIPLVIQDRRFDTNGQLLFPAAQMGRVLHAVNAEHPYWVPEFLGDAIVVNGKAWPFLDVQPRKYRFLVVNGSNARTYDLSLPPGVPMYVLASDGGFLDAAVLVKHLVVMPGERYDIVIDFTGVRPPTGGSNVVLGNSARAPYPSGAPPAGPLAEVVQFRVKPCAAQQADCGATNTQFPARGVRTIRSAGKMTRLSAAHVTTKRRLTLNEMMGAAAAKTPSPITGAPTAYPGGPLELLVNNTRWLAAGLGITERPFEGATELWEFVNLTPDAHPMHLHLVQVQLVDRQRFDVDEYTATWAGAFALAPPPGCVVVPGSPCHGFGPPQAYDTPVRDTTPGTLTPTVPYSGGNPDLVPFLKGARVAPAPQEAGWKDTVVAPPGMVTRILVRWSPTSAPDTGAVSVPFDFDPTGAGGNSTYVWHCHILDHEDNEMMRPAQVRTTFTAPRPLRKGTHY